VNCKFFKSTSKLTPRAKRLARSAGPYCLFSRNCSQLIIVGDFRVKALARLARRFLTALAFVVRALHALAFVAGNAVYFPARILRATSAAA
jgi:hypothetical protein